MLPLLLDFPSLFYSSSTFPVPFFRGIDGRGFVVGFFRMPCGNQGFEYGQAPARMRPRRHPACTGSHRRPRPPDPYVKLDRSPYKPAPSSTLEPHKTANGLYPKPELSDASGGNSLRAIVAVPAHFLGLICIKAAMVARKLPCSA